LGGKTKGEKRRGKEGVKEGKWERERKREGGRK